MSIPTEPVGSIPRPSELVAAMKQFAAGRLSRDQLARLEDAALRDTIKRFEATESPVISDGEQFQPSFASYPIHGLGPEPALARGRDQGIPARRVPPGSGARGGDGHPAKSGGGRARRPDRLHC